jgi:type I restriction enzyme M protein
VGETEIDLKATHSQLSELEKTIAAAKRRHDVFLKALGLPLLP